jgi:hypothetical protein
VMVAIVAMLTGFGSYMVSGNTNASCTEWRKCCPYLKNLNKQGCLAINGRNWRLGAQNKPGDEQSSTGMASSHGIQSAQWHLTSRAVTHDSIQGGCQPRFSTLNIPSHWCSWCLSTGAAVLSTVLGRMRSFEQLRYGYSRWQFAFKHLIKMLVFNIYIILLYFNSTRSLWEITYCPRADKSRYVGG